MHKYRAWLNALGVNSLRQWLMTISVLLVLCLGGYWWYNQQGKVNELRRQSEVLRSQIVTLPSSKEKISLEKDLIALERDSITLENSIATSAVQTIGGFLLFVTAYVSWQNLKATERNVLVAEEKQVTERFTQAINQLGSDKVEVRFGGIYALERIAKDSPRDYWTIMEVLTSFIQKNSYLPPEHIERPDIPERLDKITKDAQAALTVIRRRDATKDPQHLRLDLQNTNLKGACLGAYRLGTAYITADLRGANFFQTCLYEADLTAINLSEAYLVQATLNYANLTEANLSKADFHFAKLIGTNLIGACVRGASFERANLESAVFVEADAREASFFDSNLEGASFREANLQGAKLQRANFEGGKLQRANLEDAYLMGISLVRADLSEAKLNCANLHEANLTEANLSKADFRGAKNLNLSQVKVAHNWEQAHYDEDFRQQLGLPPKQDS